MPRTGAFFSTVAAVFSHSNGSLTVPTPGPTVAARASISTTSLDQVASRPSTSYSIAGSKMPEPKKSKKHKRSKSKKLKQHNEVWWTLTTPYKGEFREFLPNGQISHEWGHVYL